MTKGRDLEATLAVAVERGVIDEGIADKLRALAVEQQPAAPPPVEDEGRRLREVRSLEERQRFVREQQALRAAREAAETQERERREERTRQASAEIGALAALVAPVEEGADAHDDGHVLPLVYENIGWLVGMLLVLGGSVYGLREAWISFDAAGRWATVTGGLFVYHAIFVMVSAVLARRSARAGQFLGGLATCLVPLCYVGAANLSAANLLYGMVAAVVLSAGALRTLGSVGQRFQAGYWLAAGVLPPALTLLAYPHLPSASVLRFLLPMAALVAPWWTTKDRRTSTSPGVFGLALYAALVSEIFALSSNALGEGGVVPLVWRTNGPTFGAWLGVYLTAFGMVLFAGRTIRPDTDLKRRVLVSAAWFGFVLTVGASALAGMTALRTTGPAASANSLVATLLAVVVATFQTRHLVSGRAAAFYLMLALESLVTALMCRLVLPGADARQWWALAALAPPLLRLADARLAPAPPTVNRGAALWAAVLLYLAWSFEPARAGVYPVSLAAGLAVAACLHRQGGVTWHRVGALAALLVVIVATSAAADSRWMPYALVVLATVYGVAARITARRFDATVHGSLDDASLLLFVTAAAVAMGGVQAATSFAWSPDGSFSLEPVVVARLLPLLAASAGLLLRSLVDASALPSALGALGLAAAIVTAAGARTPDSIGLVIGSLAVGAVLVAATFTPKDRPATVGRVLLGAFELPWSWTGGAAVAQGFGVATVVLAALAAWANVTWFSAITIDRTFVMAGGAGVALALVSAFATRAGQSWGLRGRSGLLWAFGLAVALIGITNRIGRPLPPQIMGRNLTLIGLGLWIAARGFVKAGPWLADRLAAPVSSGRRYHLVPHAGVVALGAVLFVKAWLLGAFPLYRALAVVPPTMLIGPALLLLLVGRSSGLQRLSWAAAALVVAGAALLGAQRHLLGPALVALGGPGGAWVPADTASLGGDPSSPFRYGGMVGLTGLYRGALLGVGVAGAVFGGMAFAVGRGRSVGDRLAVLLWRVPAADDRLRVWLGWAAGAVAVLMSAFGFWVTTIPSAVLALGAALAAAVAIPGRSPAMRTLIPSASALALVVHAVAQATGSVGVWPGALLAALALVVAVATHRLLERAGDRRRHLRVGHAVVGILVGLGVCYGLASGAANGELTEGWTVVFNAIKGLGTWDTTWVPALPLGLGGGAFFVAAVSQNALVRRSPTQACVVASAMLTVAALSVLVVWLVRASGDETVILVASAGAFVVVGLHIVSIRLGQRFEDLVHGSRVTRDGLLIVIGGLLALSRALLPFPVSAATPLLTLVTLTVVLAVPFHALVAERTARHAYFLQCALVGTYGFMRATWWQSMRPEEDALVLLSLDFLLVGVTVLARRSREDVVASAASRFAALLPLLVAFLLPWQATPENALFSLGASLFYGLLGWVERSRILGTLGAVAANLALLVLFLSEGLTGLDVYLAPLGLCALIVVHLFAGGMSKDARFALLSAGTGLTYAPAALAIVFQVGNARSDYYPLGFAAACIVGIGAGMWFHIRAYLALGLAFLVLDLGTLLVRASLRDQRLGFLVLSIAGIAILSAMVYYTMNRDRVTRALVRLRRALGTWD